MPENEKNRPEVQPPPVPSRNLPEAEVQANKEGHREHFKEPQKTSPVERPQGTTRTLEPEASRVHEEAAP